MRQRTTKRKLAFEILETKCTPSTVLLACAPLDDAFHATFEQARQSTTAATVAAISVDASSNWHFQISTAQILEFVHQNSHSSAIESTIATPTGEQCRSADEMMKLGDQDLRAMVISDSLQTS